LRQLIVVLSLAAGAVAARAAAAPPDWTKVAPELLEHYQALLRIDTSSPPGNETAAAKYLQSVLEREGISARLLALEPDRANLVARLKGNGSRRPLLIMGHTDVVGVQREKWTVDPFAALRKDGYIYGRGAQDDKDNLASCLMLMLLLKRMDVQLDRDVIFLAEAGEEGTTRVGIDYVVREHWSEIEAEYALAAPNAPYLAEPDWKAALLEHLRTMQTALTAMIAVVEAHHNRRYPGSPDVPLLVLVNPVFLSKSEETADGWEGCLSVEGFRGSVPRSRKVSVRFLDRNGREQNIEAEGFPAVVLQHELDHLAGKVFLDRMRDFSTLTHLKEYDRFWARPEGTPE